MSENKVKVYKSGYFPINLEDVPEDKLIELNKNFFEILKRLRKNYLPGDKEIGIIDSVLNENYFDANDIFYSLTFTAAEYKDFRLINDHTITIQKVVIFPWSWIKRGHKARNDVDPDIRDTKKCLFKVYKKNLHKRSKFYALRKKK